MSNINKKSSWFALVVSHMSGMIDLAALPVWVGTLVAGYSFMEAQAGGLATLFLIGAVLCSLFLAPRFHRMNGRWLAPIGFLISAVCFVVMAQSTGFVPLAILHLVAGIATGVGISFTHGTMGRSANPHKVFALGGMALGIAAVVYLGGTPQLIAAYGPAMLFYVFAGMMGFAGLVGLLFYPSVEPADVEPERVKFSGTVWLVIGGIMLMALNNAMILSFAERAGNFRGFNAEQVQISLVGMSICAILASVIAVPLQKRLSAIPVAMIGAVIHGGMAYGIMNMATYGTFFAAILLYPFAMIFVHTFVFGHLSKIEPTGRALAGTPAMIMTGSAIGPFLGGMIIQVAGYAALGMLAFGFACLALILFAMSRRGAATVTAH